MPPKIAAPAESYRKTPNHKNTQNPIGIRGEEKCKSQRNPNSIPASRREFQSDSPFISSVFRDYRGVFLRVSAREEAEFPWNDFQVTPHPLDCSTPRSVVPPWLEATRSYHPVKGPFTVFFPLINRLEGPEEDTKTGKKSRISDRVVFPPTCTCLA